MIMSARYFILCTCLITIISQQHLTTADSLEGNLRVLYRSLEKCEQGNYNLGTCIRLKAVTMLERALAADTPVVVNEYLSLTPDKEVLGNISAKSEQEIEASLPKDTEEKDASLDDMIANKMTRYLQSRSIQFTLPADLSEGRKKKSKGGVFLMAALAMGGMLVQLAMGKIALLAGKALLVGKMALVLSAIIGLKKLIGGGGGGGDSHQVVYADGHGGGGGWGRSILEQEQKERAQNLAFSAQARAHV